MISRSFSDTENFAALRFAHACRSGIHGGIAAEGDHRLRGTGDSANCYPYADPSGTLTDVGAYALSDSPSGTFDQGGNVYEWLEQIKTGAARGLRGGAWNGDSSNLTAFNSNSDSPTLEIDNIGFRLASIPEPSTGLLVLTGLCGLALRRRRRG